MIFLILGLQALRSESVEEKATTEVSVKQLEMIEFGAWKPISSREILGTVKSSGDVDIVAEISGTLKKVEVKMGASVVEGEVLARYDVTGDKTQVAYENALRNLNSTRLASQNTIRSAEIALEAAQRELTQTFEKEGQDRTQVFQELRVKAENSMTAAQQAIDWSDLIVRATARFRYEYDVDRSHIGRSNSLLRQRAFSLTDKLYRTSFELPKAPRADESQLRMINFAQARLDYLREVRRLIVDMDYLVRGTSVSRTFSESDRSGFISAVESHANDLDTQILTLEKQTQSARSQKEDNRTTIIAAQNKIQNAEAKLELDQSNAQLQISKSQNEVWLANTSRKELEIKAPFAGVITEKEVSSFEQVKVGDKLFSLVAEDVTPKVVAFVTPQERDRLQEAPQIILELPDKSQIISENLNLSFKTDPQNQKQRLELLFEDFPDISVGTFVKILVPADGVKENLLPLSSFAFEPGGAEVLILKEGKALRKTLVYGEIFSNAVEVLSGLEAGDRVIRHRNRAFSGELLEPLHP